MTSIPGRSKPGVSFGERAMYPTITCVDCGMRGDLRSVARIEGDMGKCRWPNSCWFRQQRLVLPEDEVKK